MKKLMLICLGAVLATGANNVFAQDNIQLFDENFAAPAAENNRNSAQPAAAPAQEEEEFSIFSFFNFGKDKKAVEVKPAEEKKDDRPQETKLQRLTREAAEDNLDAQLALGYIFLYGEDDIPVDEAKAFKYYKMAAQHNDNVALNNLASLYYSGIGTSQDFGKAAALFKQAVQQGNTEAAVNLGFLYLAGSGVKKDSKEAINYFVIAAKENNPTAQFMLGYAYYKGFVVPQDYGRAFELLRSAAEAKFDEAELALAILYRDGLGIPQNYGKAVKYLQRSLRQGNLDAMMMLADILTGGVKFTRDTFTAHVLYNLSSVRGAPGAAESRDKLAGGMEVQALLRAQEQADAYREAPSELTKYIQQTFGKNIKGYIDQAILAQQKQQNIKK